MPIVIHTDRWPLVEAFFEAQSTPAEWRTYLTDLSALLDHRSPYVMLTDSGDSPGIPPTARAALGKLMRERADDFDRYQLAHAVILRSAIQRGMLTALNWLAPTLPGAVVPVADRQQGLAAVERRWLEHSGEQLLTAQRSRPPPRRS